MQIPTGTNMDCLTNLHIHLEHNVILFLFIVQHLSTLILKSSIQNANYYKGLNVDVNCNVKILTVIYRTQGSEQND
jgi:hypothetical protein